MLVFAVTSQAAFKDIDRAFSLSPNHLYPIISSYRCQEMQMEPNHFLGSWELDSQQSRYQLGEPPLTGTYRIAAEGQQLWFYMAWTAVNGNSHEASYAGTPDGKDYALEETAVADTVCLFFEDPLNLVSTAKRDGALILHARRTLADDLNTMTVIQSGHTEAGPYANFSVYNRLI